jgi:hypothetical protein
LNHPEQGVWVLDARIEAKLRRLGERADKFRMMQRALKEAGIDRGAAAMALFERGPRKAPLIGKAVGSGWSTRSRTARGSLSTPSMAARTTPSSMLWRWALRGRWCDAASSAATGSPSCR